MSRTTLFCLISAVVGALAATAYHQTGHLWQVSAQEPGLRSPTLRAPELPSSPLPSARRTMPFAAEAQANSGRGSGLDDFAPEERTNILVYEKANRSVVHITTK